MTHAYNGIQWIAILVHVIVLFFAIIFHEIAHGYVAYLCGDPTAKNAGRLTLNPLAHIDPFGSVILPAICAILGWPGFGYAKPVPYNPNNLRRRRIDEVLVALAGPLSNLLQAALSAGIYRILIGFVRNNPAWAMAHIDLLAVWIIPILSTIIISNIVLAVFDIARRRSSKILQNRAVLHDCTHGASLVCPRKDQCDYRYGRIVLYETDGRLRCHTG